MEEIDIIGGCRLGMDSMSPGNSPGAPGAANVHSLFRNLSLTHRLVIAGRDFAQRLGRLAERHPKRLGAALALLLCAGAGGAYAVASLTPDAADLPVFEVTEVVQPLPLQAQAEVLDLHRFRLFRSDTSRSNDTADTLLKRLGIDDPSAAAFLRANAWARVHVLGRAGRSLQAQVGDDNTLQQLVVRWVADDSGLFKRLVIDRSAVGFSSRLESAALTASTRMASGTIQSSLFAATDDARVPESVANQIADIFSGDIDFHRALRKGDRFSVIYEVLEGDGEPLRFGRVLASEFVNAGKVHQAMWFQPSDVGVHPAGQKDSASVAHAKTGGYFSLDGKSLRRAYLASPLAFSRVTSGFKMRFHPILQKWRAHLGVDYAAPTGTPVRAVGNGVVEFAGMQNGFGNVVFIKHGNNHTTVYAHLSRISVKRGQSVSQGQTVGAVGATGWATGPHLHFEFRVNGAQRDPLAMARQSTAVAVAASSRALFDRSASQVRVQLAVASTLQTSNVQ